MCDTLAELREGLGRYVAGFDASVLSATQVQEAIGLVAAMGAMVSTLEALLGARLADCGPPRGERSAAHHLARATGRSVAETARTIECGRRLRRLPAVEAAARAGALSGPQAAAVADAASVAPSAAARLVETAGRVSLAELREECARIRATATDGEARRRRIHARRSLRTWTDGEGAWHLHLRTNPEAGARLMAAVEPWRDRLFRRAYAEGRREPLEAYGADALVEAVCGEGADSRRGSRPHVLVRVDLAALLRGHPAEGEVCEIAGYGPVAASAVRDLIDSGDPFLSAIATDGERVCGVASVRRRPSAKQVAALLWLYPTCAVEGCATVAFLENDHRVPWADSGVTLLDLMDRLCPHHHDLKSLEGWSLVEGRGKRPFVPPDDPRHPRYPGRAHAPPGEAA
jgi:hypothetical protein